MKNVTFAILFLVVSCSSQQPNILKSDQPIETPINFTGDGQMGFRDGKVVIQKRIYLEERLTQLAYEAKELSRLAEFYFDKLKSCQERLADPRIGGNGKVYLTKLERRNFEPALRYVHDKDKNSVVAVAEEELSSRITRLEKERDILHAERFSFEDKNEECESQYRAALVNHGMNPSDAEAKGQWVDGDAGYKVWKLVRSVTYDPSEIAKRSEK